MNINVHDIESKICIFDHHVEIIISAWLIINKVSNYHFQRRILYFYTLGTILTTKLVEL